MLFDIIVAALILLCGVAIYFALLGLVVLYNKISGENAGRRPQEPKAAAAEKEKGRLHTSRRHKKERPGTQDPLRFEHKQREEEFRRSMQQRDEEMLRELKQRREENLLAQQQEPPAENQVNSVIP
ncbi:MAG: hypothetical protein GXY49_10920 [Syntrophomonadaceae bacterium]|nr:hypothetical protein [Syntrophomonadaceae bacterium]